MSVAKEETPTSSHAQVVSSRLFEELLECVMVDVACECHRIARLGLDHNLEQEEEELKLSAQARSQVSNGSEGNNNKYVVDIFGQTHPPVAADIFECINCGRSIVAGRFAPHLDKCMGKGRKARLKSTRSTSSSTNNSTCTNRLSNGEDYYNYYSSNGSVE